MANNPPPNIASLLIILQLVIIGELALSKPMPPPSLIDKGKPDGDGTGLTRSDVRLALPAITVKPSKTVVLSVPMNVTTWYELSLTVPAEPISPLKIVALALKFRCV